MAFVAEVKAKLGLDTTQFNQALTATTAQFGSAAGKMEKVGEKAFGFKHAFKGILQGMGIASIEKGVDSIARFFSGLSEHAEKTYEEIDALSEKNTEATISNMRKLASEEVQYQLLLKERNRAISRPTEGFSPQGPGFLEKTAKFLAGPTAILSPLYVYWKKLESNRLADNSANELKVKEERKAVATKADAELSEMDKKRVEKYVKETEDIAKAEEDLQKVIIDAEREQMSIAGKIIDLKQESDYLSQKTYKTELESIEAAKKIVRNKADIVKLEKDAGEAATKATEKRKEAQDNAADAKRDYGASIENASGFTMGEVAAGGKGILQSEKAKAKRVLLIEARARRARASGNQPEANRLTLQANGIRSKISSLTDEERDPMKAKADAIREAESKVDKAKEEERRANDVAKDTAAIAEATKRTADALVPTVTEL